MINVNELRIGNWILVEALLDLPLPHCIRAQDIGDIANGKVPSNRVEPIPLTPAVLSKCGFTTIGKSKDFRRGGLILHTRKRGFVVKTSMPIIETLHQLQNLYFALTSEELKIEP